MKMKKKDLQFPLLFSVLLLLHFPPFGLLVFPSLVDEGLVLVVLGPELLADPGPLVPLLLHARLAAVQLVFDLFGVPFQAVLTLFHIAP